MGGALLDGRAPLVGIDAHRSASPWRVARARALRGGTEEDCSDEDDDDCWDTGDDESSVRPRPYVYVAPVRAAVAYPGLAGGRASVREVAPNPFADLKPKDVGLPPLPPGRVLRKSYFEGLKRRQNTDRFSYDNGDV